MADNKFDPTVRVNGVGQASERNSIDNCTSGIHPGNSFREAVCIDADRIYDSCGDKDCLEDLVVSFTDCVQPIVDSAYSIKAKSVEVINVFMCVEPVPFHKGFYSVDMTYHFLIRLVACTSPLSNPTEISGTASFCKKVVLFGSEGGVKTFTNDQNVNLDPVNACALPKVTIQVAEPMILSSCIRECPEYPIDCCCSIPESICKCFEGNFENVIPQRVVTVSLGLFSIVQMERQVQMMIPVYDFCVPNKECTNTSDNPCDVFKKIKFPVDEFFPPREIDCKSDHNCH